MRHPISPARAERQTRLAAMRVYVITAERGGVEDTARVVEAALEGGAGVIQLRKKQMPKGEQYRLATTLRALTALHGALLIVNDHADIALAADADGVHLGQDDLDPEVVRRLPGFSDRVIGRSTHSLEQARKAVDAGADYLGVGPVYATPTKPGRAAVGLELVRSVASGVAVPFVAIGGIDRVNVARVIEAGARAVAVVRAVSDAQDPRAAVRALNEQVTARLEVQV